jgi:hypothetical protein
MSAGKLGRSTIPREERELSVYSMGGSLSFACNLSIYVWFDV